MILSIIIVNWNTKDLLMNCIRAVYNEVKQIPFKIYLVDNASSDGSVDYIASSFPDVIVIKNETNIGFAAANNKVLPLVTSPYVLLLNTDTVIQPGSIDKLISFMESHPDAGMVCGQLLNQDHSKQNSFAPFPTLLTLIINEGILHFLSPVSFPHKQGRYLHPIEVDSGIGACLLVKKKAIDEVGFLDERYFFFLEETDWALRMRRAGWKSYFVPDAAIVHLQGQSAGHGLGSRKMFYASRYKYFRKWHAKTFWAYGMVIFIRLIINIASNLIASVLTLGLQKSCFHKLRVDFQLFFWHLRSCPEEHPTRDAIPL